MFFNNYSKPGKGVNKRNPDQPRIQVFFDVLPRKMWDLFKLNVLYLLTALPFCIVTMIIVGVLSSAMLDAISPHLDNTSIVWMDIVLRIPLSFLFMIFLGQGPVTAGYTYIMREHGREHPCWLISDFFERCKANFKQSFSLWIIDLLFFYLLVGTFNFYMQANMWILQYAILMIAVIYAMMHIYVYQMMVTFDLPLKYILKNSLLLALGKAPVNLLIIVLMIVIYMAVPVLVFLTAKSIIVVLIMLLVEVLIFPPITSFAINFYIDPILDKLINTEKCSNE